MFPRVTHPSATLITPEGAFAFDLHVLGLPPAFVLSQDQTLIFENIDSVSIDPDGNPDHRFASCVY